MADDPSISKMKLIRRWFYRFRHRERLKITLRALTGYAGVLPSFLILGAQRCGTTSLFNYLQPNPAQGPSLFKELHFFDHNYARGVAWYRAHFPLPRKDAPVLTFEATPYFSFPQVASRVSETLPAVRLILLLRNPIDRAYSGYNLSVVSGFEKRSFEDAIAAESADIDLELQRALTDDRYKSWKLNKLGYLMRGRYYDHIQLWMRYFPRDHFLILNSTDLFQSPGQVLREIAHFLGIPHVEPGEYPRLNAVPQAPMNPATRAHLLEYYREPNRRLYEFLGRDLGWDR